MKNKKITWAVYLAALSFGLLAGVMTKSCTVQKAKPCTQCPQYTETLDSLKLRINTDSVTLGLMEYEYMILWEENQKFSSMLAEIENEPGGHEILEKLWNGNKY